MITRMFTTDFFLDIPDDPNITANYDDDDRFIVVIDDLTNYNLHAMYGLREHEPTGMKRHAFDIDYGARDHIPWGEYFKVICSIKAGLPGDPRFISDTVNPQPNQLKHPAATCGNSNALNTIRNFKYINRLTISFLIKKDQNLSKTNFAGFNLGIEFTHATTGVACQTVFDPKVPNDGN